MQSNWAAQYAGPNWRTVESDEVVVSLHDKKAKRYIGTRIVERSQEAEE
jgi:hypothetical protein